MDVLDCAVIGGGVVGLAVARALARSGREVVIIEAAESVGTGTSSRNSEVIHAGIYYPTGSLKARLCRAGRDALYAYCAERAIAHRRCGKLIVATSREQERDLALIAAQAQANGVEDLRPLTAAQARALEPELRCSAALLSPSTGIIDSHELMLALLGDAEAHGAVLACGSAVLRGTITADGIVLTVGGTGESDVRVRTVVNCAGLDAPALAGALQGFPPEWVPKPYFCKGNYYTAGSRRVFSRLVYPVPESAGLGVHVTLDLAGQMRFGPDVQWVDAIDYTVDPRRADAFYAAIRTYWPGLPDDALTPAYAGVRPKLSPQGAPAHDFRIDGPPQHGVRGLVHLYGIESPGLTACLALAEHAVALLA